MLHAAPIKMRHVWVCQTAALYLRLFMGCACSATPAAEPQLPPSARLWILPCHILCRFHRWVTKKSPVSLTTCAIQQKPLPMHAPKVAKVALFYLSVIRIPQITWTASVPCSLCAGSREPCGCWARQGTHHTEP